MNSYDVIVIGGGAAGMMAAISSKKHHPNKSVAILDRTFELGRKLLTAGAGRGNLTNINLEKGPSGYYHGDQRFIENVFSQFGYADIMNFFRELGIPTYMELKTGKGKIFPSIDHAKTIRDILVEYLKWIGVEIYCNCQVDSLSRETQWVIHTKDAYYTAKSIVFASGGKTYPALGSDGSGYTLISSLGHTIIEPVVSAVPVVSKNMLSHFLQGEKMDMEVTAIINGNTIARARGDVMFTQYGFSGPAIFDVSREFSIRINREKRNDCSIQLCFLPGETAESLRGVLNERWKKRPEYTVAVSLWGLFTQKTAGGICASLAFPKELRAKELSEQEKERIIHFLLDFEAQVDGTRGWNEGEFTAGGVDTAQIDSKTMQSLVCPGLFFAGEIVDVDGNVGGFNLSWAWATGWISGKHAGDTI